MAYKDKETQRKAVKQATRRYREKSKGITKKVSRIGGISMGITAPHLPPERDTEEPNDKPLPANFGQDNCECRHCANNRASGNKHVLNHGPHKPASELSKGELNRVALPGDVDYETSLAPGKAYKITEMGEELIGMIEDGMTARWLGDGQEPAKPGTPEHKPVGCGSLE